jgi:hypothetical protein
MTTQWLLAKYVSDVARHEPQNVGLILLRDGEIATRFIGQRQDGSIDGRLTKYVRSFATYRAWVEHWRSLSAEGVDALLAAATASQRDENYVLEVGGQIVLGADPSIETAELLDDLYGRLVDDVPDPALESVKRLAERVIDGIQKRTGRVIERDSKVVVETDGVVDELRFDYRYNNGKPHLMRTLSLSYTDSRSWDQLHSLAWSFNQVHQAGDEDIRNAELIALIRTREPDQALERQLTALRHQHAKVVDVANVDQAQAELLELIRD